MSFKIDTNFEGKLTCASKNDMKFSPEYLKVSKLGPRWHPFVYSWKCMSLKFTGELCVMIMKNDAKFKKKLTCQSKIDMSNLTNFDPSTGKSQNFAL